MKSRLQSYPCPLIINYFWNLGFLLGITIYRVQAPELTSEPMDDLGHKELNPYYKKWWFVKQPIKKWSLNF